MSELGVSINRIRSKTSMLLIDTSTGQHQGNYTCIAKNKAGITQYTTTLHVHGKPNYGNQRSMILFISLVKIWNELYSSHQIFTPLHDPAYTLTLARPNISSVHLQTHFFSPLPNSPLLPSLLNVDMNVLPFKPITLLSPPTLAFVLIPLPNLWFLILISFIFLVQPQIEPFNFNQQGMNGGGSLKILCTVSSGDPPFEMSWFKDNASLTSTSNFRRSQRLDDTTLMLTFSHLSLDDAGNYSCLVSSPAGNTSHSSTLQVKGT